MKNILKLHEAIVVALVDFENRQGTFDEIAAFIEKRELFPDRKGGITLAKQVMLRATQSSGRYLYLFEQVDKDTIRLRNLQSKEHQA